jgi:hypothetical protein
MQSTLNRIARLKVSYMHSLGKKIKTHKTTLNRCTFYFARRNYIPHIFAASVQCIDLVTRKETRARVDAARAAEKDPDPFWPYSESD